MSLLSSLVTAVERPVAQVDDVDYSTAKTEISTVEEKTEIIVEERKIREAEVLSMPEVPPQQTITERDDDWFVLLDVIPRETSYVPPGTAKIPVCCLSKTLALLCFILCLLI